MINTFPLPSTAIPSAPTKVVSPGARALQVMMRRPSAVNFEMTPCPSTKVVRMVEPARSGVPDDEWACCRDYAPDVVTEAKPAPVPRNRVENNSGR
jgi:hypothetical protein